jgi:hypothetical protein
VGVVEERVGDGTGGGTGGDERLPLQIIEAVARRERPRVGLSVAIASVDLAGCFCEGEDGEGTAALADAVAETANAVGCRWRAAAQKTMCVFERCVAVGVSGNVGGGAGGFSMERCLGRGRVLSRRKPCDRRCIAGSDCLDVLGKNSEVDETGGMG